MLADWQIREYVRKYDMIDPFMDRNVPAKVSYGLSSYGYDIRVANTFKIFQPDHPDKIIDPANFDIEHLETVIAKTGDYIVIPPNSFALAHTVEHFNIPRDILTICVGKSTYARCGIIVNVTPFEPEWRGYATLEISNTTPQPAAVYAGYGIAQLIFLKGEEVCRMSYADKKGKYQDQPAVIVGARS